MAVRSLKCSWNLVVICSAASLLIGCNGGTKSGVTGTWKDTSVDAISHVSASDKDRMRMGLTLNPDGTGTMRMAGTRAASRTPIEPKDVPITWKQNGNTISVLSPGNKESKLTYTAEAQTLTTPGGQGLIFRKP